MIVAVSGSRGLPPLPGQTKRRRLTPNIIQTVNEVIDNLPPHSVIYQGLCEGIDLLARERAIFRRMAYRDFPADWGKYGYRAGFIRNTEMAESDAEMVFAFCVANSKGTMHCVKEFLRMGKGVIVHDFDSEGNFLGLRSAADF